MITNLFSLFDPSGILFFSNWVFLFSPLGISLYYLFLSPSGSSCIFSSLLPTLTSELDLSLSGGYYSFFVSMVLPLFLCILFLNSFGLLPYVFTPTRHLIFPLGMSLAFWSGFMLFSFRDSIQVFMRHLVPLGTPMLLIPLMVLIETIRILIRPITLAVRLMANMVAGHLLLRLAGGGFSGFAMFLPVLVSQTALYVLEMAVAGIQAYVFLVLLTLYLKEAYVKILSQLSFSWDEPLASNCFLGGWVYNKGNNPYNLHA